MSIDTLPKFKLDIGELHLQMRVDPESRHGRYFLSHFNEGISYEPEVVHVMHRALRPGDTAIDVGAYMGFFTILMSQMVGPSGFVVSVEPVKENLELLRENCALNDVHPNIISTPLWRAPEAVTFFHNADDDSSGALWDVGTWKDNILSKESPNSVDRIATTLDKIIYVPVKLLKLDTEGAEQAILEGGESLMQGDLPYIISELNPNGLHQLGYSIEGYRAFMRERGYEMFALHSNGDFPSLIPKQLKIKYNEDQIVKNILFSTMHAVCALWGQLEP